MGRNPSNIVIPELSTRRSKYHKLSWFLQFIGISHFDVCPICVRLKATPERVDSLDAFTHGDPFHASQCCFFFFGMLKVSPPWIARDVEPGYGQSRRNGSEIER